MPPSLFEGILQSQLLVNISASDLSGLQPKSELTDSLRRLLATQLEVSESTIRNVRMTTVGKVVRPLVQVNNHRYISDTSMYLPIKAGSQ